MKVTALIVAGGSGRRMGSDINKVFLQLAGKTIIEHTVDVFLKTEEIDEIVIVTREEDILECRRLFAEAPKPMKIVVGGKTRQESVYNGLKEISEGIVAIHDGARALINRESIKESVLSCMGYGAAAVGVSCVDTLKKVDAEGFITETVDREGVYRINTPQTFNIRDILRAHQKAIEEGFEATDDCALYERYIGRVKIVPGEATNIKITFPEDIMLAETILKREEE